MTKGGAGGETSLGRLLSSLEPRLDGGVYSFSRMAVLPAGGLPDDAVVAIREDEGWTLVSRESADVGVVRQPGARWARILLSVHSDLTAVGLLAAVSTRLAAERIPVNAMAGWFHDHLFVPWERRFEALAALSALQAEAVAQSSS